jgi:hypothetical protein
MPMACAAVVVVVVSLAGIGERTVAAPIVVVE